jgi:hypothetical protein
MAAIIGKAWNILRIAVALSYNAQASASIHPAVNDSAVLKRSMASAEPPGKHAFRSSLNKIFLFWNRPLTGRGWRCEERCVVSFPSAS